MSKIGTKGKIKMCSPGEKSGLVFIYCNNITDAHTGFVSAENHKLYKHNYPPETISIYVKFTNPHDTKNATLSFLCSRYGAGLKMK